MGFQFFVGVYIVRYLTIISNTFRKKSKLYVQLAK